MSEQTVLPPAARPCGTCPYRRDVPSGVWVAEEYSKLPAYDRETGEQPQAVFLCHQQDSRACAGWAGCHDMDENLALRIAALTGRVPLETIEAIRDYVSPIPLWESGAQAARHGLAEVEAPGGEAARKIDRLIRRAAARDARTRAAG